MDVTKDILASAYIKNVLLFYLSVIHVIYLCLRSVINVIFLNYVYIVLFFKVETGTKMPTVKTRGTIVLREIVSQIVAFSQCLPTYRSPIKSTQFDRSFEKDTSYYPLQN